MNKPQSFKINMNQADHTNVSTSLHLFVAVHCTNKLIKVTQKNSKR